MATEPPSSRCSGPKTSQDTSHVGNVPPCSEGESSSESVVDSDNFVDVAFKILFGTSQDALAGSNNDEVLQDSCAHEENVRGDVDEGFTPEEVVSAADEADAEMLTSVFARLSSTFQSDIDSIVNSSSSTSDLQSENSIVSL